jgi:hypothetical protein
MIPFRTQRLATSVVNRILMVARGIEPMSSQGSQAAPEPIPGGDAIDAGLQQPTQPVDAAPELAEEVALADMLQGP